MARGFNGSQQFKGRGAISNPANRFEKHQTTAEDDGWYQETESASPLEVVLPDRARSVITSNDSPDVGFDVSINPYRGCSHGCIFCFARPSHAFLGLSPGLDFETRLFFKQDAAATLRRELSKTGYRCKPIALGINTDSYQPLEKRLGVTRSVLEVLEQCKHPVTIVTKGALVLRDLDLLSSLARQQLVHVALSITSLNDELKRNMEPRAASPQARLRVIRELAEAHIPVSVLVAPVIPALTDHEMEDILSAARAAGATSAGYVLLRLPLELATLFREWLAEHYPDRAKHVMSIINQARGGKDYDAKFGQRMRGTGLFADLLERRFELAKRRLGFEGSRHDKLRTDLFIRPAADSSQLTLAL